MMFLPDLDEYTIAFRTSRQVAQFILNEENDSPGFRCLRVYIHAMKVDQRYGYNWTPEQYVSICEKVMDDPDAWELLDCCDPDRTLDWTQAVFNYAVDMLEG